MDASSLQPEQLQASSCCSQLPEASAAESTAGQPAPLTSLLSRLGRRSNDRLRFARDWVRTHRRESAAVAVAVLMLGAWSQQDSQTETTHAAADAEFSGVEQFLTEFEDADNAEAAAPAREVDRLTQQPPQLPAETRSSSMVHGVSNSRSLQTGETASGTTAPGSAAGAAPLQIPATDSPAHTPPAIGNPVPATIRFRGSIQPIRHSVP